MVSTTQVTLISEAEYLSTLYHPDAELVDDVLE